MEFENQIRFYLISMQNILLKDGRQMAFEMFVYVAQCTCPNAIRTHKHIQRAGISERV